MSPPEPGALMDWKDLWGLALRIVALVAGLVATVLVMVTALPLILLLLLTLILAAGLSRPVDRLQHRSGLPRGLAVLVVCVAIVLLLVVLGALGVPPIVQGLQQAASRAPADPDQVTQRLAELRRQFPFLPPLDQQVGGPRRSPGAVRGASRPSPAQCAVGQPTVRYDVREMPRKLIVDKADGTVLGLQISPGTKGLSIRLPTADRPEPVSVGWLFPPGVGG